MNTNSLTSENQSLKYMFQNMPKIALAPVPLGLLQPILSRIVNFVAKERPELFARLGIHTETVFVINPTNLPFVLRLVPNPDEPSLTAHRRSEDIESGASISGTFLTLLKMIDGELDGDALFFTRDLKVEGNTEAVVCLRNAMDDLEGSIVDDITATFGPLAKPLDRILSLVREK